MLLAVMILPFASQAQVGTYLFSTGVDNTQWYTLTSDSIVLKVGSGNDSYATPVTNIGFTFNLAGTDYTQFSANSDGTVRLGSTVVGTGSYSTPFSTSNAGTNAPKICGLGCDGYLATDDYIAYQLFGTEGNHVLVVEISTGTYTSSTRNNHYTFQVQLAEADGSITLMYSPTAPAAAPAAAHQLGVGISATDFVLFDNTTNTMTAYTAGTTTTNATGTWPDAGRYYTIAPDPNACYALTGLEVTGSTTSSITLSWIDDQNSGATYTVYNMVDSTTVASGIAATSYTVTGLTANTGYLFGVEANCSASAASAITTVAGRTACESPVALPYVEGFNGYYGLPTYPYNGPSTIPGCWDYYSNGTNTAETTTSAYYGGVGQYNGTSYGSMESNNPYLYMPIQITGSAVTSTTYIGYETARGNTKFAVMPDFGTALSGLQISFNYKMSTAYSATGAATVLELGYVTGDTSTFVSMVSYNSVSTTQSVADLNLSTLAAAAPAGARLAFKFSGVHNGTGAYSYTTVNLGIDNIRVETLPSCARVTNLTVAGTTSSTITLNWNDTINTGATYTVYNMADTSVVATNVNDNTYTVTGLTGNTLYTFGVVANCSASDASGETTVTGRTACAAYALPFTETFDATLASDQCWRGASNITADSALNGGVLTLTANTSWTYSSDVSNGLPLGHYRVNIYGTSCKKWMITPEIDLTTASNPLLTFDAAFTAYTSTSSDPASGFESNTTQKFMVLVSTDNGQTWTLASDIPLTSLASSSYLTQYVNLASYAGQTVRVAFYAQSTVSGGDNNLHIDNISIDESTGEICYAPTTLAASNVTTDGATLTWTGDAASYNVYAINGTDTTLVQNVTAATITLTGLTANTDYTYCVTSVCTSSESPVVTVTFHTLCNAVALPYQETFAATSANRDCWTLVSNNTANVGGQNMGFVTYNSHDVMCFSSWNSASDYNQYGYSPMLDATALTDADSMHVRVVYGTHGEVDPLYFGYTTTASTTPTDYTWVGPFYTSNYAWTTFEANLPLNVVQLAVHYASTGCNYRAYVDTIQVTGYTIPSCPAVTALAAGNVTADGATLTWTGEATSYNVYAIAAETATLVQNVATATYTLTGLTANTEYTYGVTSVCGTDESDMVTVTFRTLCNAVALPFTESFEATSATVDCWEFVATANVGGSNGMGIVTLNGNSMLRFSSYSSASDYNQYAYSPVLDATTLTGADSMHVRVRYATYGANDNLYFGFVTSDGTVNWNPAAFTTTGQSDFQVFEANLPLTTAKLAVHYYGNYSWYAWIDSVEVTGYTAAPQTANITFAVNDATMGTTNPAPGTYNYNIGENYTVTAQPNAGYHFANWTFTQDTAVTMLQVTDTALEFTMYAALDGGILTAVFAADSTPVPPVDSIYVTLAVNDATMGTTVPAPGTHAYVAGETFTATAVPETGYHLTDWQMTLGGQVMPTGVTDLTITDVITSAYNGVTLTAVFAVDADTTVGCAPVTLPYTETFEDASATVDCWTTDGPGTWNFGSYSSTGVTYEGSNYAYIRHATSGNVTKLISPVLSVSADATALQLTFAHIQKNWSGDQDEMRVYYRTSATDSWVMAAEYTTDIQNWTVENIVIPANTHQVAFEMTDGWGYGVAVDSVVVSEMTAAYCYAVTGLTATPTAFDVALTWNDANNDGATYTIYSATGDVVATGVTGNNYTVTNLTPDSPYTFAVVANCTATSASEAATVTTRTLVTCPAPTALTATIIPGNGTQTTLAWTAGATETAWQICLNGDSTNLIDVTTNPYTLTGLTPETPYTAMVRANCDVNDQSAWSNTVNFTPTNAYIITVNDGATTNSYVPIYGTWADDITKSQFIIPAADLAAMQYGAINKLTFYASQASVSWGAAEFNVYLTETTDTVLTALADYTTMTQVYAGTLSINNNIMEVNLTNPYLYMGGNLKVGFLQTVSGSWSSSSWYGVSAPQGASWGGYGSSVSAQAFLPKTTIAYTPGTAPSCLPVTGLTVSDVTATGATLTWNGDAASYNVYAISATDTTLVQNVATTTITLAGLTAMTHYTYGVTAVCTNDESIMMITTFTTACAAVAIPFTEGFEGNSNTLACWSVYATSNNTGIATSATTYAHTGDGVFVFSYSTNPPQFLISPELSGTGSQLQVEFDYRIMTSSYPESFVLGYSTTTADTSAFTWGTEQTNLLNETYAHYTEVLNASGIKYVAVKYTANDMYYLFIDDVVIRDVPACAAVTNLTVDSVTMTSVSLSWTDANNTGATYTVYNDSTVVATGITTTNYTVTGLTAATTYTFGVVANCSATEAGDMVTIVASTACGDIVTLPYYEGFENGFDCWSTVNGSADGQPWNVQTSFSSGSVTPHTGSYMAASWSWNNAAYHADAWLISPKFVLPATLPAGEELTLSWWERTNSSYPDSYSVVLSTTTNDTAAFTTVLRPYDEAEGSWTLQSVDLTAYAGQSIYLAFHHMDYDENYLLIDDIELSLNAPIIPADTLTVTFAVNDATMGTTTPAPGTYTYVSGDTINFAATANSGYHFDYWLLTTMGETDTMPINSWSFEADDLLVDGVDNLVMQAVFSAGTPDSIAVTYAVNDATMGTTTPAPGVHYYYVNDLVSVTATPNAGYMLDHWFLEMFLGGQPYMSDTIDAEENPLLLMVVDQQYADYNVTITVTAYFAADTTPVTMYNVTLGVNDTTMGSVNPAGTTQVAEGSNFIATATANSGYHFVAWLNQTGDTVSRINIYSFTVTSDVTLMAVFAENDSSLNYYTVSVAYDNSKGRIDGEGEYEEGSSVSLIAYPFENYEFVAWLDENMDTLSTNTAYMIVNLQSNRALTAIFRPKNSINDVEADNVTVYSVDNRIVVRGAEGRQVFLFDVNGRMLSREASATENIEFRVNNSGVYLVKVGNAAAKRVVVLR